LLAELIVWVPLLIFVFIFKKKKKKNGRHSIIPENNEEPASATGADSSLQKRKARVKKAAT
jgi:hypothetical protein